MSTFPNGLHLKYYKELSQDKPIQEVPAPRRVIIPLQQNLGCPCEPLVKVGDEVAEDQKIGDTSKFVSAPVHASISGKIVQIARLPNPCGYEVDSVVIEGGGVETRRGASLQLDAISPDDIRKIVREAGIVGLGGATFPTHVKISPPKEKPIDTLIINGCECEPYITADHRLMLERTEDILFGAKTLAKAVGAKKIIIGIEDNKKDAIKKVETQNFASLQIVILPTKYPQGGEKQLIQAILGREVPSGGLPMDVGVVVNNVATCVAVTEAIKSGMPLIKRVITLTGSGFKESQNLLVRIGTPLEEVIAFAGGLAEDTTKIIMGGPMMGLALDRLDQPVVKATSCLLALRKKDAAYFEEISCIRCGRCIEACPVSLMPKYLADYARAKNWDMTKEFNAGDCIECGCCSYVCPSRIYLVQYIRIAKRELQTRKAKCQ